MFERIIIIILGSTIFYILRFKILKKALSPLRSGIIGAAIIIAGIQLHYNFLPYESFQGGITYTSLGFFAFLIFQYGFRRAGASSKSAPKGEE